MTTPPPDTLAELQERFDALETELEHRIDNLNPIVRPLARAYWAGCKLYAKATVR